MDLPAWGWLVVAGVACVLALGAVVALRRVGGQGRQSPHAPLTSAEAPQGEGEAQADPALLALVRRQRDQLVAAADKQRQLTEELRAAQEAAAAAAANAVDPALRGDLEQARQGAQALREQHAGELARLAQTAIEQVDALQRAHLAELARLRGPNTPSDTAPTHAAARAALGGAR